MNKKNELFVFEHTSTAWVPHRDLDGKTCMSRIMLLFYKWQDWYEETKFYMCLDCLRIGTRSDKDLTEEEYSQRKKEAGWE